MSIALACSWSGLVKTTSEHAHRLLIFSTEAAFDTSVRVQPRAASSAAIRPAEFRETESPYYASETRGAEPACILICPAGIIT